MEVSSTFFNIIHMINATQHIKVINFRKVLDYLTSCIEYILNENISFHFIVYNNFKNYNLSCLCLHPTEADSESIIQVQVACLVTIEHTGRAEGK